MRSLICGGTSYNILETQNPLWKKILDIKVVIPRSNLNSNPKFINQKSNTLSTRDSSETLMNEEITLEFIEVPYFNECSTIDTSIL